MKKIFTTALSFFTLISNAQIQKGTWSISTSTNAPMNLQLDTYGSKIKTHNFTISPGLGYFIGKRWEIGGDPVISFMGSRVKYPAGDLKSRSNSYGLNIYTRYYLKTEGKLLPYLTANIQYSRYFSKSIDYGSGTKDSYKGNYWRIGGGAGVSWFITPKAALFSELNYMGRWGDGSGYNSGLTFKVGFQIYFGGKNKK